MKEFRFKIYDSETKNLITSIQYADDFLTALQRVRFFYSASRYNIKNAVSRVISAVKSSL